MYFRQNQNQCHHLMEVNPLRNLFFLLCIAGVCMCLHSYTSPPQHPRCSVETVKKSKIAIALQLQTLYKNKCKHFKFLHLSVFFASQHEHFQFLLMSACSSDYIPLTVPSGLAIWGHQKSIHLCSLCAQLLHIIRHERETWRARMKDKTCSHVLWQLSWRPSVTQARIVLIKYRTLLVHPPRSTWTGRL